jgi:hypothetical protein
MEALFRGRKELFENLYIYDKWDWAQQYPVIKIDWTRINHSTPENMETSLCRRLRDIAEEYGLTLREETSIDCFDKLITLLHDRFDKKVVILIDEYDKPVTAHLFDSQLDQIRTAVHDFYQVMKGADDYLRFVFLTGVSKFSGLSIFSALNNPQDITLREEYAAICGYTQEELESNFSEYIDRAAEHLETTGKDLLEEIRYWYNGYTWDGKTAVYNPFSTMNFFQIREFDNYWFSTGTPTFLMDIIRRRNCADTVLQPVVVNGNVFKGYDPANISEVPLLFQTGYLTVKHKEMINKRARYTLGVPNMEVEESFLTCLLEAYGKYSDMEVDKLRRTMQQQITACDEAGFARSLEAMIATVPYDLHIAREAYYHSLMLIWMRLLGFSIHAEEHNSLGRADAVWEQQNLTVVSEIKYGTNAETQNIESLLDEAMKQIHDRRYYNKYTGKILLLGIAFAGKNVGCRMEELTENTLY